MANVKVSSFKKSLARVHYPFLPTLRREKKRRKKKEEKRRKTRKETNPQIVSENLNRCIFEHKIIKIKGAAVSRRSWNMC